MQQFSDEFQDLEQHMYAANFIRQGDAEAMVIQRETEQRRDFLKNLAAEIWSLELMPLVVSSYPEKFGPPQSKYAGRFYSADILLYESEGIYLVSGEGGRSLTYVRNSGKHLELLDSEPDYTDDLLLPKVVEYIKANAQALDLPAVIADTGVKLLRLPYVKPDLHGYGRQPARTYLAGRPRSWKELLPDFLGPYWHIRLPDERHDYDQTRLYQNDKWQRVVHYRSSENYGLPKSEWSNWPTERLELEEVAIN